MSRTRWTARSRSSPSLGPHAYTVVAEIPVGTEPRGLAITPNGTRLYVANHTDGHSVHH